MAQEAMRAGATTEATTAGPTAEPVVDRQPETGLATGGDHFDAGRLPPDDQAGYLRRLDGASRGRALHRLQRRHGNAYVQRLVAAAAQPDQTAAAPMTASDALTTTGTAPTLARTSGAGLVQRETGGGQKHTFKAPKYEREIDRPIGSLPVKLRKVVLSGEMSIEEGFAGANGNAANQGRAGVTGSNSGIGLQGEVGHKWNEWRDTAVGNVSVNTKGSAEVTTSGGEIGLEAVGLEFDRATIALKFTLLSYNVEKSEIEFLNPSVQLGVMAVKGEFTTRSGQPVKYELKPTVEVVFGPDPVRIGSWLVEKFGEAAVAELGLAAGFVAVGFATIAAGVVTASLGGEVYERVDKSVRFTRDYCGAYGQMMRGEPVSGNSEWANKGKQAAEGIIGRSRVPLDVFREEAKKKNLRAEAMGQCWPQIKTAMLTDYREDHWFEWKVYGEDGPGYKILKRILDEPQHLNF